MSLSRDFYPRDISDWAAQGRPLGNRGWIQTWACLTPGCGHCAVCPDVRGCRQTTVTGLMGPRTLKGALRTHLLGSSLSPCLPAGSAHLAQPLLCTTHSCPSGWSDPKPCSARSCSPCACAGAGGGGDSPSALMHRPSCPSCPHSVAFLQPL